jgi:radical SAM/Cys-rich protein
MMSLMLDSKPLLFPSSFPPIRRRAFSTLQVNLGLKCNQSCNHCHVNAGPNRTELMSDAVFDGVIDCLSANSRIHTLDITGGAPELHPRFSELVSRARGMGKKVLDRCNLTVLFEPGQEGLADFLAENNVEIVASLPCYLQENVDAQRGKGVYDKSIAALKKLNELGYGVSDSGLSINLVYNPGGAYLPPSQVELEQDYRQKLFEHFGIHFNSLFTITNMPIARFGSQLQSHGEFDSYLDLLRESYQSANLESVMCKDLVSVSWQGLVYDCDFNQMLDMAITEGDKPLSIFDLIDSDLDEQPIIVAEHCYGCTAGQGSSCGGALG